MAGTEELFGVDDLGLDCFIFPMIFFMFFFFIFFIVIILMLCRRRRRPCDDPPADSKRPRERTIGGLWSLLKGETT